MKYSFRTYLYFTLTLLLGLLSGHNTYAANSISSNQVYSSQYIEDSDIGSFHYSTTHQTSDFECFAEAPEKDESENENSSKTKSDSTILDATAFINALLFENFSKELEKSVFRSPNTLTRPKERLFLQFQVFII